MSKTNDTLSTEEYKQAREDLGLSVQQWSERLGISPETHRGYVKGNPVSKMVAAHIRTLMYYEGPELIKRDMSHLKKGSKEFPMGKIIAVLGPKGGPGKTTTSVHLGRGIQKRNFSVAIVDTDPQASAMLWRNAGESQNEGELGWYCRPSLKGKENFGVSDQPEVFHCSKPDLHLTAAELTKDYDFVIIDGAAVARDITVSAILAATNPENPGLILIPFATGSVDAWGNFHLLEFITKRREQVEVDAAMFLSKQHPQAGRQEKCRASAMKQGEQYNVPLLNSAINRLMDFEDSQGMGCTAYEFNKRGAATQQTDALVDEVLGRML